MDLPYVQWAGNFVNNASVDDYGHGTFSPPDVYGRMEGGRS